MKLDADSRYKYEKLRKLLQEAGRVAVAFSGGLDSTLLLAVAADVLGVRNVIAVTVFGPTFPSSEQRGSVGTAERLGVRQVKTEVDLLYVPGFASNPPDRCYLCKKEIVRLMAEAATASGFEIIADGMNADDSADYRPGTRAADEAGVLHPLMDAGLGKDEIRSVTRALCLPTAGKPSMACLASRFPYGSEITADALLMVDAAEDFLREKGFDVCRARHFGDEACIEVSGGKIPSLTGKEIWKSVVEKFHSLGYKSVSYDPAGYRTGSMNRTLHGQEKEEQGE